MTPKNPTTSLPCISKGKYADYVAALGPAPTGFRYLKVGEKFVKGKDYILATGTSWSNSTHVDEVCESHWPCITPSPTKKERQLGRKVGPHDTRLQALTRAYEALGKEIAALKAELS